MAIIDIGSIVLYDWTIEEKIGEGSYGAVYKIRRGSAYSALKVIRVPKKEEERQELRVKGMNEQEISKYFLQSIEVLQREVDTMSPLRGHSNIVSYEDHQVVKDGNSWVFLIRMELVTPLLKYQTSMSEEEVVKMGIDLCQGLAACEQREIVHRDIKPQNIFINDFGNYKIGDFGIARVVQGDTQGTRTGTPYYAAPEVFSGQKYNSTVDIYSLGLVLYNYLNGGRLPFEPTAENLQYGDRDRAYTMRLTGKAVPRIKSCNDELNRIIAKACAFEAGERYQTAAAFKRDLERYRRRHYEGERAESYSDVPGGYEAGNSAQYESDRRGMDGLGTVYGGRGMGGFGTVAGGRNGNETIAGGYDLNGYGPNGYGPNGYGPNGYGPNGYGTGGNGAGGNGAGGSGAGGYGAGGYGAGGYGAGGNGTGGGGGKKPLSIAKIVLLACVFLGVIGGAFAIGYAGLPFFSNKSSQDRVEDDVRSQLKKIDKRIEDGELTLFNFGQGGVAYYDGDEPVEITVLEGFEGSSYTRDFYYENGTLIYACYDNGDRLTFFCDEGELQRVRYLATGESEDDESCYDEKDQWKGWPETIQKDSTHLKQEAEAGRNRQNGDGYVFNNSSSQTLTEADYGSLDLDEVYMGLNEIYARRGMLFTDETVQSYFDDKSWYHGAILEDDFDADHMLSQVEKENLDILTEYLKEKGYL